MTQRFSIEGLVRDVAGVLARRWALLLLLTLVTMAAPTLAVFWFQHPNLKTFVIPSRAIQIAVAALHYLGGVVLVTAAAHVLLSDRAGEGFDLRVVVRGLPAGAGAVVTAVWPLIVLQWVPPRRLPGGYEVFAGFALLWLLAFGASFAPVLGAALAERRSPWSALARAFVLSRGRRLIVFGLVLSVMIADAVLIVTLAPLSDALLPVQMFEADALGRGLAFALIFLTSGLVSAALFLELRRVADAIAPQTAAAVFD